KKEEAAGTTKTKKGEPPIRSNVTEISVKKSPGYLKENLLEKRESYLTALYLDAYRALEVGRLRRESDSGRIAIWGRGTGCAMAIAAASLMNRATCLFLEKPALCALETSLRHSKGVWADEIKEGLKGPKKNRKKLQENIQYFDSLYFAEALKLPVGMAVNLTEDQNDPRSAFSLFHLLKDEKDMHLFTQDDALAKVNEKRKIIQTAVRFFSKHILDKELEEDVKVTGEEEKRD
ncbi:MAG: acetylxylan esterase, partial [Leptospiraceae bacterium]|nr:acetylxylan esterase [Leptospiraceae bacterium]